MKAISIISDYVSKYSILTAAEKVDFEAAAERISVSAKGTEAAAAAKRYENAAAAAEAAKGTKEAAAKAEAAAAAKKEAAEAAAAAKAERAITACALGLSGVQAENFPLYIIQPFAFLFEGKDLFGTFANVRDLRSARLAKGFALSVYADCVRYRAENAADAAEAVAPVTFAEYMGTEGTRECVQTVFYAVKQAIVNTLLFASQAMREEAERFEHVHGSENFAAVYCKQSALLSENVRAAATRFVSVSDFDGEGFSNGTKQKEMKTALYEVLKASGSAFNVNVRFFNAVIQSVRNASAFRAKVSGVTEGKLKKVEQIALEVMRQACIEYRLKAEAEEAETEAETLAAFAVELKKKEAEAAERVEAAKKEAAEAAAKKKAEEAAAAKAKKEAAAAEKKANGAKAKK